MEKFQIIKPSAILAPYIKNYWILKTEGILPRNIRTFPTGNVSLMFHRGARIFSHSGSRLQPRTYVCGQEKTFNELIYAGSVDMIAVVFNPAGAKLFLKVPLNEISGMCVDIHDLDNSGLVELQTFVEDAVSDKECIASIECFLIERIKDMENHNVNRINCAIELIVKNETDIDSVAHTVCLSPKQFNRIFTGFVGTRPKEFQRIIRFQRALFLLQTRPYISLTQIAFDCGYYDQVHFIKEFRQFSGYTPLQYTSLCLPYSDYFS
ncbi:MAG: AraC family transcriptional regulator [Rikenellaceae bacterium]|nr:AraC family transcriptional regulator [Rikenellaceae bacterium]